MALAFQQVLAGDFDDLNAEAAISIVAETLLLHRQWILSHNKK